MSVLLAKCCDQCHHNETTPCSQFIHCVTEGPLCHKSPECQEKKRQGIASALRRSHADPVLFVGAGTCGFGAGIGKTLKVMEAYHERKGLKVQIVPVGCIGMCTSEPIVDVQLPGKARVSFQNVTEDRVEALLDEVYAQKIPVEKVLGQFRATEGQTSWEGVPYFDEHPFFAPQTRWVLAQCGVIDPGDLDEYIARGGYRALATVLRSKTPQECCDIVEQSGLRGRGGGGFPTGRKWKVALGMASDQKYFVCNADEGDPGAFMDRAVGEGDPHRLLEGLAIGAYAIGATKAYIYIRAEYPLAIDRLVKAIEQAQSVGLLGNNILDSGFNLEIVIKKGAGAFVCGEETALLHSIEGKRGMPRLRPPFPAQSGLFGKPTVINNVETLANIPVIFANGAEAFASVGTASSKGTKVFALSGKVTRTGLVEIAMGMKIRDIVLGIGGGCPNGRDFKAVQIGGPSGGCISNVNLDIEIDYESLKTVGAMMGSGGLVVMDQDTCMVDVAKFFMDFIQRESCGKCIPCREGTRRMLEILQRITRKPAGHSATEALERFKGVLALEELAQIIRDTSLCGLGQTAPNPVLSTLRWFRNEYEAHVYDRACPAKACLELRTFRINVDKCKGCAACVKKCPSKAIFGAPKSPHYIVENVCVSCGTCMEACRFEAIEVA